MATGLTVDGFIRKRLPEIRSEIIAYLQERTGLVFETTSDSITGRFIDVFAEREAAMHEQDEAVYSAMYPSSAEGVNLDNAISFSGARRIQAKRTTVYATIHAVNGTIVDTGFSVRASDTKKVFSLFRRVNISKSATNDILLTVQQNGPNSAQYDISINSASYSYIASPEMTGNDIAIQLTNVLEASEIKVERDANKLRVFTENPFDTMNVETSTNIDSFANVGQIGTFVCLEVGPVFVPTGALTEIVNSQSGVLSIINNIEGVTGRLAERDDEVRAAYPLGTFRLGAGNPNAIRANLLQNVANISYCEVYENRTKEINADGLPEGSIEVVVMGGDNQAIANEYFRVAPGGIELFGNVDLIVKDSTNKDQPVSITRPVPVYFWVRLVITRYNEEDFPGNGRALAAQSVVLTGNSIGVKKDVIPQRFYGDIFAKVAGVKEVHVYLARSSSPTDEPPSEDFVEQTYPISIRELPQFNTKRVDVQVF